MDNDLERSVRILEDAVSSTGKGLFKTIASQRKRDIDLSITMTQYERLKLLDESAFSDYEDTMNILMKANQTLGGSVIQNMNPWQSTLENLYTEFFEILQNYSGGQDILELVADLARCCSDAANVIQGLKSKVAISFLEEEKQLINERDTWRLLFILYQDRLTTKYLDTEGLKLETYTGLSEKVCIEKLFKRDSLIRETQLVIDWLENCSAEEANLVSDYPDYTNGWENTLHQIKSSETIAFSSSRKVVDKLDPDAPHYQRLPLHDLDIEDEKRLCKIIFNKIRCGRLEEAQEICITSGHAWRATLLEGWKLYHNANIKAHEQIDVEYEMDCGEITPLEDRLADNVEYNETEGNPSRDIWKLMSLEYCKKEYLSLEEKAAVAAYTGNLPVILSVCKSWEDYLWAYLRTMVDIRVESEIRENVNREYLALPDWYWNQRMSLNAIFEKLESESPQYIISAANSPEHIIQKLIILNDMNQLMNALEEWVEDSRASTAFLRFATHLLLFLDQIGELNSRDTLEVAVEEYVKRLWKLGETRLVAFYLSKVSESRQIHLYASHLEGIVNNDERKAALKFADDFGLSVLKITKRIVENIRNRPDEIEHQGNLTSKINETDIFKISALDWILFSEEQIAEVLIQSNALIFTFLTLGKLDAAQLTFNKIPQDAVEKLLSDDTNQNLSKVLREHLSYKVYLEAQDGFNEWYEKYKNKPRVPEEVPETASFTEKVTHQHKMSQYNTDVDRWKITTAHLAKAAKKLLYNVLLFPDGWLTTAKDGDYLRTTCLPEIVLLLYIVLSKSDLHEECLQLADIIASEKHQLYSVYSREKLEELLMKLCESSLALMKVKQTS